MEDLLYDYTETIRFHAEFQQINQYILRFMLYMTRAFRIAGFLFYPIIGQTSNMNYLKIDKTIFQGKFQNLNFYKDLYYCIYRASYFLENLVEKLKEKNIKHKITNYHYLLNTELLPLLEELKENFEDEDKGESAYNKIYNKISQSIDESLQRNND